MADIAYLDKNILLNIVTDFVHLDLKYYDYTAYLDSFQILWLKFQAYLQQAAGRGSACFSTSEIFLFCLSGPFVCHLWSLCLLSLVPVSVSFGPCVCHLWFLCIGLSSLVSVLVMCYIGI